MITQEEIIAGLKKIGPCRPGELADHLHLEHSALGYHLKKLLTAGAVKATGTSLARRFALLDQKFEEPTQPETTTQLRKPKKGKKAKKHKARKPQPAAPRAQSTERFIPTVDADSRLHIINGGEPMSFDEDQTEKIAELLFVHYKE